MLPRESGASVVKRASRHRVRVNCSLRLGAHEAAGHTVNLSTSGMYVRLAPGQFTPTAPGPGSRVPFRLSLLDAREALTGLVEVVWVNADDRDVAGRRTVALGARFVELEPAQHERIAEFLRMHRHTVLIADSDAAPAAALEEALGDGYRVLKAASAGLVLEQLESHEVTVLICGERVGDLPGAAFLRRYGSELAAHPAVRTIRSSRLDDVEIDQLIKQGLAYQFLRSPWRPAELAQVLRRAVGAYTLRADNERLKQELERAHQRLTRENVYLRQRLEAFEGFEQLVGSSEELRRAFAELERIRRTDTTVHIHGETGTGKELVARALHAGGPRAAGPFVAQNCAGFAETVLESTLFGHRRGAFTGAEHDHAGVFEQANGGTLFLDEIAELAPPVQAALLRAIQEREIVPLGATRPVKIDVRLVSATHKDLREEVRAGRFREDLFFRVVVLHVRLPPLRERRGDIPLLAKHFLGLYAQRYGRALAGFRPETLARMEAYSWPGNVRELENEIARIGVLADERELVGPELLSPHILSAQAPVAKAEVSADGVGIPRALPLDAAVAALERALVDGAMRAAQGNITRAAELLKMERSRLSKTLSRTGAANG